MMRAKTDRNARIISMARSGLRPTEIQELLEDGTTYNAVKKVIHNARQSGVHIPPVKSGWRERCRLTLPPSLTLRLRPHAQARGVEPSALVQAILEAVVADGLVGAVMDDGIGEGAE